MSDDGTYYFVRIKNGNRVGDLIKIIDAANLADATFNASALLEPGEELVLAGHLDKLPLY